MKNIKNKVLALILTAAMLLSVVPFTLTASAAPTDDNFVLFSANDDADGKLYYTNYKYGINGLGYAQTGFLKNSNGTAYTTGDGSAYLFAEEIDGENMWKFDFNADENGKHVKTEGGGTYIHPFYSTTTTLGEVVSNAEEYTHLAVRIKLVDDGTGRAVEDATRPLSINLHSAGATDGSYGAWEDYKNVYFQDINTGEKISVTKELMQIPVGFDGYLVFPSNAVYGKVDGTAQHTSLSDFYRMHIYIHWNCKHSSTDATDSWVGTELFVGDMILTKNIDSFNLVYGAPSFELTSSSSKITVVSDDANAVYSFDKNAEASKWLTKEQFNIAARNLKKGTVYTVYAKYPVGTKIISREISTTSNGVMGYLMDIPEREDYYTYKNKCVTWGTRITMSANQDPFSQSASYNSQGGFYARKSGDEYFLVINPQESENTDGTIKESNGGIYFNSISDRGFNEDGSALTGMPEGIETDKITHLAFRIKVQGGNADQYSSVSLRVGNIGFVYLQNAYLIDNTTGLVVNPYYRATTTPHRIGITGEFDGWLMIPYKILGAKARDFLENSGGTLSFYFHTSGCTNSDHGKDSKSDWSNKSFLLGDIAIVENEEDFINSNTRPYKTEGTTFGVNDLDYIGTPFDKAVSTFEATVRLPKNYPHFIRGGIIMGSYGFQSNAVNYEIQTNGNPSVYYYTGGKEYTKTFDQVSVLNDEFTHIAIVNNIAENTLTCYINGEIAQVLDGAIPEIVSMRPGVLGGDYRDGNTMQFRGEIKNIALYSDVRTAEEIKADMTKVTNDNLMAYWDLTKPAVQGAYLDESGNGHDVILGKLWYEKEEAPKDYAYSFAVVGDTQIVATSYQDRLAGIYEWIAANKESKNIQYVMGLGDITDGNKDTEWAAADTAISKLNGIVPYSLVRGNHGSTDKFNALANKAPYNTSFIASYDEKLENTYRELVVGDIRYLIFTLDCCPSDDVLNWAGDIIAAHPEHNVIITTHVYLTNEGEHFTSSVSLYGNGPNKGDGIWNKLVSKHENITLVLSGHVSQSRAILNQIEGDNGNIVSEMLIDPQGVDHTLGATGMVTMLYFSEDGSRVAVESYSTVREKYYVSHGEYEFDINVIEHNHAGGTATCTESAICDYCKESYGEPLGHNYVKGETVPATPSAQGYTVYTCENCGATENRDFTDYVEPTNKVTGVTVTPTDIGFKVTWDAYEGATGYYVRVRDDAAATNIANRNVGNVTSYEFKLGVNSFNASYDKEYVIQVIAYVGSTYQSYADADKVVSQMVITNRVVDVKATPYGHGAKVTFRPVEGANKYWVFVRNAADDSSVYTTSTTTTTVNIVNNMVGGTEYYVQIVAYKDNTNLDTRTNALKTKFVAPYVLPSTYGIAASTPTSFSLTWDAVAGATTYFVQIRTEDDVPVRTATAHNKTIAAIEMYSDATRLSANTTYKFRIAATINGITTGYGEWMTYTTSNYEPVTVTADYNAETGKVKISWTDITDSHAIYLYRIDAEGNRKYFKYLENGETSYTIKAPTSGTYSYGVITVQRNMSGDCYNPIAVSNTLTF